ncbi:FUSC family protein [Methylotenera mobilis]|uniref:Fusaric acid resistance protein conserved region n=1 Tax=Methylotenera mobilis (strain JLW8 / ATCC BAA-1282 / DSM 17540) TaxID=583345 RepID=C6WXB8_METML|nr:FUSC family protein [Methylotenera mobilis]ACT48567.1 Fusaric acid resistance protein conserved region [Methylotenera mobilis JLW8]
MKFLANLITNRKERDLVVVQAAWREWLSEDAPIIAYIFKVLLACLLAMWLSLRFELDQPRTAMMTVAIVMQFRSGMVFAKSYYRFLGTSVGILVSFLLVALFAQERVLFLVCMGVWIGLCTAGSMIFRNYQSYAFVLAGYTLCIVGLPSTITPELTFNIGVTRISEILIGLICATLVSDLIFPQRMWNVMLAAVRRRFKDFSDLLQSTAVQPVASTTSTPTLLRFLGDIFSLETFQASAGMENDKSRLHRQKLSRMNHEFMEVSTSFHAFEQLLRRQHNIAQPQVSVALQRVYQSLGAAIMVEGRSAQTEQEAKVVSRQLSVFRNQFSANIHAERAQLTHDIGTSERLDFETGCELLQRLTDELYVYTSTYASLAVAQSSEVAPTETAPKLEMHFDPLAVTLAGIRGTLSLAILSALWILTDWRSGVEAITLGVISSTLFATTPSPTRTIKNFMIGAIIGTLLAYFCNFHLLTQAHGFWMLAVAVAPGIIIAAWFTTRPATAIVGAGVFMVYLMHIGFNSAYNSNPVTFINDAIADLLAVLISGIMYGLIDLSGSRWSRQRIAKSLRNLVVVACRDTVSLRRGRLETGARELVQRAGSAQRVGDKEDRVVIEWLLSTLEIGHAVIALREYMQVVEHPYISNLLSMSLESVAQLYDAPSEANRLQAVNTINHAIAEISLAYIDLGLSQSSQHQITVMLHFIRSALLDEESVLVSGTQTTLEKY